MFHPSWCPIRPKSPLLVPINMFLFYVFFKLYVEKFLKKNLCPIKFQPRRARQHPTKGTAPIISTFQTRASHPFPRKNPHRCSKSAKCTAAPEGHKKKALDKDEGLSLSASNHRSRSYSRKTIGRA